MDKKQIIKKEYARILLNSEFLNEKERDIIDNIIDDFEFYGKNQNELRNELSQYIRIIKLSKKIYSE